MKSFEERKEAILSRSAAKIAKGKKTRRCFVATCVPLVLCLTLVSGWVLAGGVGLDGAAMESAVESDNMMPESAVDPQLHYGMDNSPLESPASSGRVIVAVKLISNGRVQVSTSQVLFQALEKAFAQRVPASEPGGNVTANGSEDAKTGFEGDPIEGDPYVLTVVYQDGSEVRYTLRGTQLTSADGKATYILAEEAAQQLQQLQEELNTLQDEYEKLQEETP